MQTKIMELTHEKKLQQLQVFSKATMTDKVSSCHYESISVTDSATQVDHSPLRPDVRDAQVSPIKPHNSQPSTGSGQETATEPFTSARERPLMSHRRTRSEGDSLFYKKKAKDAYGKVKRISKQLQDITLPQQNIEPSPPDTLATHSGEENHRFETMKQHGGFTSREEPLTLSQRTNSHPSTARPHKCTFQQQVKTLQKKLRALNGQVR